MRHGAHLELGVLMVLLVGASVVACYARWFGPAIMAAGTALCLLIGVLPRRTGRDASDKKR